MSIINKTKLKINVRKLEIIKNNIKYKEFWWIIEKVTSKFQIYISLNY